MASSLDEKLMKWQADERWQNGKFAKWQVDEMAFWQNNNLIKW
jgi:hypothetical protein